MRVACAAAAAGDWNGAGGHVNYSNKMSSINMRVACAAAAAAGDWNGAGGHVNYSNNATRAAGTGWDAIQAQIAKLEKRHAYHIAQYGEVSYTLIVM
jgi:hypothetical protein